MDPEPLDATDETAIFPPETRQRPFNDEAPLAPAPAGVPRVGGDLDASVADASKSGDLPIGVASGKPTTGPGDAVGDLELTEGGARFRVSHLFILACAGLAVTYAVFLALVSMGFNAAIVYAEILGGSNAAALVAGQLIRALAALSTRSAAYAFVSVLMSDVRSRATDLIPLNATSAVITPLDFVPDAHLFLSGIVSPMTCGGSVASAVIEVSFSRAAEKLALCVKIGPDTADAGSGDAGSSGEGLLPPREPDPGEPAWILNATGHGLVNVVSCGACPPVVNGRTPPVVADEPVTASQLSMQDPVAFARVVGQFFPEAASLFADGDGSDVDDGAHGGERRARTDTAARPWPAEYDVFRFISIPGVTAVGHLALARLAPASNATSGRVVAELFICDLDAAVEFLLLQGLGARDATAKAAAASAAVGGLSPLSSAELMLFAVDAKQSGPIGADPEPDIRLLLKRTEAGVVATPQGADGDVEDFRRVCLHSEAVEFHGGKRASTLTYPFVLLQGETPYEDSPPPALQQAPTIVYAPLFSADDTVLHVCAVICEVTAAEHAATSVVERSRAGVGGCPPRAQRAYVMTRPQFTDNSEVISNMMNAVGWAAFLVNLVGHLLLIGAIAVPIHYIRRRAMGYLPQHQHRPLSRQALLVNTLSRRLWVGELRALLLAAAMVAARREQFAEFVPEHVMKASAGGLGAVGRMEPVIRRTDRPDSADAEGTEQLDADGERRQSLAPDEAAAVHDDAGGIGSMARVEAASLLVVAFDFAETGYSTDNAIFAEMQRHHEEAFSAVMEIVRQAGGTVVFLRSATRICASWNTFDSCPAHATAALRCASSVAVDVAAPLRNMGLRVGVAVHTGSLVGGFIGDRLSVSDVLLGAPLALAASLAELHVRFGEATLLVTDATRAAAGDAFAFVATDAVQRLGVTTRVFDIRAKISGTPEEPVFDLTAPPDAPTRRVLSLFRLAFDAFCAHTWADVESYLPRKTGRDDDEARCNRLRLLCAFAQQQQGCAGALPNPYARQLPHWLRHEPQGADGSAAGGGALALRDPAHRLCEFLGAGGAAATRAAAEETGRTFSADLKSAVRGDGVATAESAGAAAAASAGDDAEATGRPPSANGGTGVSLASPPGRDSAGGEKPGSACYAPGASLLAPSGAALKVSGDGGERDGSLPSAGTRYLAAEAPGGSSGGSPQQDTAGVTAAVVGQTIRDWGATLGGTFAGTLIPEGQLTEVGATIPGAQGAANAGNQGSAAVQSGNYAAGGGDDVSPTYQLNTGTLIQRSAKLLGRGSYGVVYMGMEQHSGRLVAMKFMPLPSDPRAGELQDLENEVSIMDKVRDPHVVDYYGYAIDPASRKIVLVMECLVAGSLQTLLKSFGRLPLRTAVAFVRHVVAGLCKLHSLGIVHRDVKPQNVLVTAAGQCKLTDFGASVTLSAMARGAGTGGDRPTGGAVMGTPLYLAPEAARGHATFASDLWAVGIMFLQLTTGEVPYAVTAGVDVMGFVWQIGSGALKPEYDETAMAPEVAQFVQACLRTEAAERPTVDELLQFDMFRLGGVAAGAVTQVPSVGDAAAQIS